MEQELTEAMNNNENNVGKESKNETSQIKSENKDSNQPNNVKHIDFEYERATNGRRIAAFLVDAFLSLVTGAILLILTIYLLSISPVLNNAISKKESIQLNSGLYEKSEDQVLSLARYLEIDTTRTVKEKNDLSEERLTAFFSNPLYFENNEGIETYNDLKLSYTFGNGEGLFKEENGKVVKTYDSNSSNYANYENYYWEFYSDALENATGYLYNVEGYAGYNSTIILIDTFAIIGTFLFPFIIYCYLVPLINRRSRQTLGMMATRIGIIDGNGLAVKPLKLTLRFLFFYIFEVWGSLFAFLIPMAISIGFMVLKKSHQTLHDYIFNTYCVDLQEKTIYKDVFEYQVAVDSREKSRLMAESNDNAENRNY